MLRDSNAKFLLYSRNDSQLTINTNITLLDITLNNHDIYNFDTSNLNLTITPEDLIYIIYTSGSTGKPKGAMLCHRNVVRLFKNDKFLFDFSEKDIWTMFHSVAFDFSVWEMYGALLFGGKLILVEDYIAQDPKLFITLLKTEKVTILNQTPTYFYKLLKEELKRNEKDLSVRYIIFGGEALKPNLIKNWHIKYPFTKLINMYGITETTVHVTFKDLSETDLNSSTSNIGVPIPTLHVIIVDNNLKLLPFGTVGEMCVIGEGVFKGYLNREDLNINKLITIPEYSNKTIYRSGDTAIMHKDGHLEYIGRIDHQIKIRGFRIELGEIEEKILNYPNIESCIVTKKTDEFDRELLCAYYIKKGTVNIPELRRILNKDLPIYMIPQYFIEIDKIPININGKTNLKDLPIPKNNNIEKKLKNPRNSIDKRIIDIYKKILHTEKISIEDSFFELGGDSLTAINIVSVLNKEFNINISVKDILEKSIIIDLSDYISKIIETIDIKRPNDVISAITKSLYPLSSAQKRIYYTSSMNPKLCVYNISGGIEFYEKLDIIKIKNIFKILINRHESFRTYFEIIEGEIYQKILTEIDFDIPVKSLTYDDLKKEFKSFNTKFDFTKSPLLKVEVIFLENNNTLILINMHHIISDGTSMQILFNEFCKLYNGEQLSPTKFTYRDFINYEQYFCGSDQFSKNKAFWLNEFNDEIPTLNFPTDFTRPSSFTFNGHTLTKIISKDLSKKILDISKKYEVTPYIFLLSTYYILLYKYTGQDDIIIGTPTANRNILEFSNIIGMFVNTIAIRKKIDPEDTFVIFLKQVKEKFFNCFEHQSYPFDELVKDLNIPRDISRNPIFDTMFTYQNTKNKTELNDIYTKYYIPETNISKFDLSLEIIPQNEEFILNFEYCTDLFKKEFIENLSDHYINLLNNILQNQSNTIKKLEILSSEEKSIIFNFSQNCKNNLVNTKNLVHIFKDIVNSHSNDIAIELNNQKLTYLELDLKSNFLAKQLISNNVQKGDIVGVYLNKSIELIISIWAILKIGAIYMPMYTKFPINRLEYIIQNSNASVVITNSNLENTINSYVKTIILNSLLDLQNSNEEILCNINLIDNAYTIYTSGSTGTPKGVLINHLNLVNFISAFTKYYNNISEKDTFLSSTNISFDVSIWEIFLPLLNGARLVLYNEETIQDIINYTNYIIDNKITGLYIPPNILDEVFELLQSKNIYINKLLVGVESIKKSTLNKYLSLNPNMIIINGYGPTETTICATALNYNYDDTNNDFVSIGKPLYNNNVYILNKDLQPQPVNIPGEIYISGNGVGNGYINNHTENEKRFLINTLDNSSQYIYKTGDLAKWNNNKTINFIGRNDSQIKISGYRIELKEIENKILEFPGINKALVICQIDSKNRKYLIAYITISDKISTNKLKEYLRRFLPKYMIPSYYEILEDFPYTPNGKIDRKLLPLPKMYKHTLEHVKARNELDRKLLKLYEDLLNVHPIGITDNFFELGGDSLLAINLQIEIMKITEGISYADIFLNPTVKELSDKINNMNNIVESFSNVVDLMNCNTYIKNFTNMPSNIIPQNINNILLTGATGFLGAHILENLLRTQTGNIYCLLRKEKGITLEEKLLDKLHFYFDNKFDNLINNRIFIIQGDLTLENLGLSTSDYSKLENEISAVINCAAKVSHYGKYELYKKINVDGVENLIKFCKASSKKLYHISTISVSGTKITQKSADSKNNLIDMVPNYSSNTFKENNFYIDQLIDNVYVKSKFEAEKLIISELKNGLDGYILRVGNLMSRFIDGKFQKNIEENAYINRLLSFIRIRNVPQYFIKHSLEFTPVDYCADAIIKILVNSTSNNRIFHIFNNNRLEIKSLLEVFEKNYYKINVVSNTQFKEIINSLIKSSDSSKYLDGLISDFDRSGKLNYEQEIVISSEFSNKYLETINFIWPKITEDYLTKFLNYLNNLYKF